MTHNIYMPIDRQDADQVPDDEEDNEIEELDKIEDND